MELQNIREHCQANQRTRVKLTYLEQEINEDQEVNLERANMHLERLLDKEDKDLALLRHMSFHYRARNMNAKARIKSLNEKLRKETSREKEAKEQDRLRILAEASLAQHGTP
ncbi:Hypothetical predicted protein [Olea europaea subsp. europaea]|uniref:Uncharacterized protein n=1 Tax=Olea europaea subsp. europaea TaxID=158383 RepID=A0A8S0SG63_OLEEU|nr:Hypothetical predicted protein [Olea europaea subsp. europaea]